MNIKKIDFTQQKKSTQNFQNKNLKNSQLTNINFGMKQIGKKDYANWAVTMMENLLSKPEEFVREIINANAQSALKAAKVKAGFKDEDLNLIGVKDVVYEVEESRKKDLNTIYDYLKAGGRPKDIEFDHEIDATEGALSSDDDSLAHFHLKSILNVHRQPKSSKVEYIDDGIVHDDINAPIGGIPGNYAWRD